jgi:hypothetical protein
MDILFQALSPFEEKAAEIELEGDTFIAIRELVRNVLQIDPALLRPPVDEMTASLIALSLERTLADGTAMAYFQQDGEKMLQADEEWPFGTPEEYAEYMMDVTRRFAVFLEDSFGYDVEDSDWLMGWIF